MASIPVKVIVTAVDNASRTLRNLSGSLAKSGRDFGQFKRDVAIASAGIIAFGAGALKLASDAGKFESVSDAFSGMTKGMISDVDKFVSEVKRASAGTLSSMDIMQGGTRALSLIGKQSFQDFGKDFQKMAELSKKAARATGQDVNFMFDSLIMGVSRSSKMILDNLGITLDMAAAQSKYKDEIMKTTGATEVSAEKASLLRVTLEELDSIYKDVSVTSGGLSGAQQKLRAMMEDLRIEIGTQLMPIFNDLIRDIIIPFATDSGPKFAKALGGIVGGFKALPKPVQGTLMGLTALLPAMAAVGIVVIPLKAAFSAFGFILGLLNPAILLVAANILIWVNVFKRLGDVWTMISEQYKTSVVIWQNTTANVTRFLTDEWGKFVDDWESDTLPKIQNNLSNLRAWFSMTGDEWAVVLGQMASDVDNWIVKTIVRFENWKDRSSFAMQEFERNAIISLGNWAIITDKRIEDWSKSSDRKITDWVNSTSNSFIVWSEGIWRGPFLNLQTNIETFVSQRMERWKTAIPAIWAEIADRWTNNLNRIGGSFDNLRGKISGAIGKISEWASKFREAREAGLEYQTGGIVPGPVGAPRLATVHGGEEIVPVGRRTGGRDGGGVTLSVNVGIYAGSATEKRMLAMELWEELGRLAKSQNKTPQELLT